MGVGIDMDPGAGGSEAGEAGEAVVQQAPRAHGSLRHQPFAPSTNALPGGAEARGDSTAPPGSDDELADVDMTHFST